jgi:hypothetical protein
MILLGEIRIGRDLPLSRSPLSPLARAREDGIESWSVGRFLEALGADELWLS